MTRPRPQIAGIGNPLVDVVATIDAGGPARHGLIPAQLPADLAVRHVKASALPANWRTLGSRDGLQAIGRAWLEEGRSAVLAVPSAVVPAEHNYLLNPRHPDFARIVIGEPKALDVDVRLLRNLSGNS